MESIEDKALETYSKNIEYFSKNHKELMKLLTTLDIAINTGDYEPRYDLEYIDGYFDIKDIKTGAYVYNGNSLNISKDISRLVDFKKNKRTFEGFPIYTFSDEQVEKAGGITKLVAGVLPMTRYYFEHSDQKGTMKEINKFIFVGVRLGLHIPIIHEKIKSAEYLIIEDDLEIFKLSLFTTQYYTLAQDATLYFSVADDENLFLKTTRLYLRDTFYENRYLKYVLFPTYPTNKLKQIQNSIMTQSFIFFPYKVTLDKFLKPLEYINDGYNMVNLAHPLVNDITKDKPVLVLAAGPSFKKNIDWVKENHHKFLVIAVSSVLNTLYKLDIKPDIVTHIDGEEKSSEHYDGIDVDNFLKDAIFLFGSNVSKDVRSKFKKSQIFYYEEQTYYFKEFGSIPSPCVGSFSLILSLYLQAKETYLLGLDFAINQETGATHSSDHIISKELDIDTKDVLLNSMDYETNLFPIQGNFSDVVYTNGLLHASVQVLFQNIPVVKNDNQTIYNMNDGAKIKSCLPTHALNVETNKLKSLDKEELSTSLSKLFLQHSKQTLSPNDVNSLKKRLTNAQEIKERIKEYSNRPTGSHVNKYEYDMLGIVSLILKNQGRESNNLTQVFFEYFQLSVPIIIDFFNTKGLKNEKRHIKKLDKMLIDEMNSICDMYIDNLDEFIKTRC